MEFNKKVSDTSEVVHLAAEQAVDMALKCLKGDFKDIVKFTPLMLKAYIMFVMGISEWSAVGDKNLDDLTLTVKYKIREYIEEEVLSNKKKT